MHSIIDHHTRHISYNANKLSKMESISDDNCIQRRQPVRDRQQGMGHFGKYHNTLFLSPQILHCFQFLLGLTMVPRENQINAYA